MKIINIAGLILTAGLAFAGCAGKQIPKSQKQDIPVQESPVNEAYIEFFNQQPFADDFYSIGSVRYQFIYLDEDDCPELLLSEGSGTAFPFRLYRYNPDTDSIEYIASFSQQGRVRYLEKEGQIISCYGNMGRYITMVSEINGNQITLLGAVLSSANPELSYYIDFPLPDTMQGQHFDNMLSLLPETDPKYQVSEEEYETRYQELIDDAAVKTVLYNDMQKIP